MLRVIFASAIVSAGGGLVAYSTPERLVAYGVGIAIALAIAALTVAVLTQRDLDRHLNEQSENLAAAEAATSELRDLTKPDDA